jgi:hypothetical protein
VLSSLLFIIVMEALSKEFRVGLPWELLYADKLVLMVDSGGQADEEAHVTEVWV